VELPLARLAGF